MIFYKYYAKSPYFVRISPSSVCLLCVCCRKFPLPAISGCLKLHLGAQRQQVEAQEEYHINL